MSVSMSRYLTVREEKVVEEFEQCIRIVYDEARKKIIFYSSGLSFRDHIPSLDEKIQTVMFRLVGKAENAGDSQKGCECANSTFI